jgi:hypothetical protein
MRLCSSRHAPTRDVTAVPPRQRQGRCRVLGDDRPAHSTYDLNAGDVAVTISSPCPIVAFRTYLASAGWPKRPCAPLAPTEPRPVAPSPDGGLIADYHGVVGDPSRLAERFSGTAGVIEHGLFPPQLVSQILVASPSDVEELRLGDSV